MRKTDFEMNFAVSKAIEGIVYLARQGSYDEFSAALNFLIGRETDSIKRRNDDVILSYESSFPMGEKEKIKPLIQGLQILFSDLKNIEGIEAFAEGLGNLDSSMLKNSLQFLSISLEGKRGKQMESVYRSMDSADGAKISLNPRQLSQFIGEDGSLSISDRARILFKRTPDEKISGNVEKIFLNREEKLKLFLAAYVDNLSYLYQSFAYMNDGERFHELFIGLSGFVSPREKKELKVELYSEKTFEMLLDAYGFNVEERKRMQKIFSEKQRYGAFNRVAVRRIPSFHKVPNHIVNDFVDSVSIEGKLKIIPAMSESLKFYDFASPRQIADIQAIIDKKEELDAERAADSLEREEYEKILVEIAFNALIVMRSLEPKIYEFAPYPTMAERFESRNFISHMNQLAVSHGYGIEGVLDSEEAKKFLLGYYEKTFAPFEEKNVISCLRKI